MKIIIRFVYITLIIVVPVIIITNFLDHKVITETILTMGTTAKISVVLENPTEDRINKTRLAVKQAVKLLNKYDARFSFYSEDSELSRINKSAAFAPVKLSEELKNILIKALEYSIVTDGVFDITASSLQKENGYGSIVLNENKGTVYFKDPNAKIDLGGIATGFAVDKVADYFKSVGINNYLIDVGGDIYACGRNQKGTFWQVGIRNPRNPDKIIKRIVVRDEAITTSGNYIKEHIIDTKNKRVASGDVLSVTVIAPTCLDADVFATAFFVMGINKAKSLIQKHHNEIKAVFIVKEHQQLKIVPCNLERGEG